MQVYSLLSSIASNFYIFIPWSLNLFIRVQSHLHGEHTVLQLFQCIELIIHIAISVLPGTSESFEGLLFCPVIHYGNNAPILREEKHVNYLKILHQAGFETARKGATITKLSDLTIVPCHSHLKHTTTLFSLSDHYTLSREWNVIVDQVQTNYHGWLKVPLSVRCHQTVDYEGYSLCSYVFKSVKTLQALHSYHSLSFLSFFLICGKGLGFRPRPFPQIRM